MRSTFTVAREQYPTTKKVKQLSDLSHPSEHRKCILLFFLTHHVATVDLVMRALPHLFDYAKKSQRHLDSLVDAGDLERIEYSDFYVYFITNAGMQLCRDFPEVDVRALPDAYDPATGSHILHELNITDTAVAIYEHVRATPGAQVVKEGRHGLHVEPAFRNKVPDYWYLKQDSRGLMLRCVEVIAGVSCGKQIRRDLKEYERWSQTDEARAFLLRLYREHGAKNPVPEFEVHCILQNRNLRRSDAWKERLAVMQTFFLSEEMQGRVWTVTGEALSTAFDAGQGINTPMWHRGKDLTGDVRDQWQDRPRNQRRNFVDECMRSLPTYPLFA